MEWCYNCEHIREITQLPNGRSNGWCKEKKINVDPEELCKCWKQMVKPSTNKVKVELELDTTKFDEQIARAKQQIVELKQMQIEAGVSGGIAASLQMIERR